MELSDLLDSDTLECCEHMTDENTESRLLLAAYDSISEPLEATLGDEHGSEPSPPSHDYRLHPLRVRKRSQPAPPLSA